MFSCEFYQISKNTFFYRTPLMAASELRASILSDYEYIIFAWKQKLFPAGIATLWQHCHNVVVGVVTTLWHGQKWELCRHRFPTWWQRHSPTLSRRYNNVAATSPQHMQWISGPFYYRLFWFLSLHRNVRVLQKCLVPLNTHCLSLKEDCIYS